MSEPSMSDVLAAAIENAIGQVLADHDAVPMGYVGMVQYLRTDPDGDTTRRWSAVCHQGIDPFALSGLSAAVQVWADGSMRSFIMGEDD